MLLVASFIQASFVERTWETEVGGGMRSSKMFRRESGAIVLCDQCLSGLNAVVGLKKNIPHLYFEGSNKDSKLEK